MEFVVIQKIRGVPATELPTYIVVFDADVLLWLEGQVAELEQGGVESKTCQLEDFLKAER